MAVYQPPGAGYEAAVLAVADWDLDKVFVIGLLNKTVCREWKSGRLIPYGMAVHTVNEVPEVLVTYPRIDELHSFDLYSASGEPTSVVTDERLKGPWGIFAHS